MQISNSFICSQNNLFIRPFNNPSLSQWSGIILGAATTALVGLGIYRWSKASNESQNSNQETLEFAKVKEKIKVTFCYVIGNFALTGLAATAAHVSGFSLKVLSSSFISIPIGICSLVALVSTIVIKKEDSQSKHLSLLAYNVLTGVLVSPLGFISPAILAQAAGISIGLGGLLALTAMMAPDKSFMKWEGPLLVTLTSISLASAVALFFPRTAFAYGIDRVSLYGGLLIHSGLFMGTIQKLVHDAETKNDEQFDPILSSLNIYLDLFNIGMKVLQIVLENEKKNKNQNSAV